jgi:hypothetical protein
MAGYQRMRTQAFTVGALLALSTASLLRADLASTNFSDLVAQSDLIIEGRVVRAEILGPGQAGEALVAVKAVHKGTYSNAHMRIEWSGEVHDQRIDRVGEDRLLFLKRKLGGYEGTHYGRSYWVFQQGNYGVVFTPYSYPTSKVRMDVPNMIKTTEVMVPDIPKPGSSVDWVWAKIRVIYLVDVLDYVKRTR